MSASSPLPIEAEFDDIAKKVATVLRSLSAHDAESMLLYLIGQIARNVSHINLATLELLKTVPVPPEVISEANRTFDEKEVVEAIDENRAGGGLKLNDFLPELEKLAHAAQ